MQEALSLARRNLGQTWPNPSVGAVLVKDGAIIGRGYTGRGGRPHAEVQAIAEAGAAAKNATLYVTLEPCAHHGKTPPCSDAVIKAGIAHCIVACRDPHRDVNGKGIAQLKQAGIQVSENICEKEAREINRGFFSVVEKNRPYVALKIATSADGKIAYPEGSDKQWITGEAAREEVHRLRSEHDVILTGIGTVLADDPMLTVRIPGMEDKSPVRVVLDRHHRLPAASRIATTKDSVRTWILNAPTIEETLRVLAEKGVTRVLVEAGQTLNSAFINSGLVDRIYWFRAPSEIGAQGLSAFSDTGTFKLLEQWKKLGYSAFPPDTLDILEPCSPAS